MLHRCIIYCVAFVIASMSGASVLAQDGHAADSTGTQVYIETVTGGTITGTVIEQDSETLTVHDPSFGTVTVERKNIQNIEYRDPARIRDGKYWYKNPSSTRYLLGPTAWPLESGEGYYQNTYLLINTFFIGAGDNVVLGGGFEILSLMSGNPVFLLLPKIGIPIGDNAAVGGGVAIAAIPDVGLAGIGYGLLTLGNRDDNVTFGLGYGFSDGKALTQPVITISGMIRPSRSVGLVTENWLVPADGGNSFIFSYGIRFFSESISVDIAFVNNADIMEEFALGIPFVSLTVLF